MATSVDGNKGNGQIAQRPSASVNAAVQKKPHQRRGKLTFDVSLSDASTFITKDLICDSDGKGIGSDGKSEHLRADRSVVVRSVAPSSSSSS